MWPSYAERNLDGTEKHHHQGNDGMWRVATRASGKVRAVRHHPANDKTDAGNHKTGRLAEAVDLKPNLGG